MPQTEKPWLKSYPSKIKPNLDYPAMTLGQLLDDAVSKRPDTVAMIFEDQKVTYREFGDQVNRFAKGLLDIGVKKEIELG